MDKGRMGIALGFSLLLCGCVAQNLQLDQEKTRSALLTLQEDQFLDNAIRIQNRLPWVQVDYNGVNGVSQNVLRGSLSGGIGGSRNFYDKLLSPVVGALRTLTWSAAGSGDNASTRQLTITSAPVYYTAGEEFKVYQAYKHFVDKDGLGVWPGADEVSEKTKITEKRFLELHTIKNVNDALGKKNPNQILGNLYRRVGDRFYFVRFDKRELFLNTFNQTTFARPSGKPAGGDKSQLLSNPLPQAIQFY